MKIYQEIKQIAGMNAAILRLSKKLDMRLGYDGVSWPDAVLLTGCKEKNGHLYKDGQRLDRQGMVDDTYYCEQYTGYCEDDYHGTLYFKTNVPGQFVAVPFDM